MHLPDPEFPPLLTGHGVSAPERPLEVAVAGAADGHYGAGDLVWARDTSRFDMAIVLEPEVPVARAMEMLPVALVAVGDSLGALVPPEVSATFGWPDAIRVNGARAGELNVVLSDERPVDDVPAWMVIAIRVELRRGDRPDDPGLDPDRTDLMEEGCGDITRTDLLESVSRHFLSWVHRWETEGFRAVHEAYVSRLEGIGEEVELEFASRRYMGRFVGIDEHGGMILETASGTIGLSAVEGTRSLEEVLP